MTKIPPTKLTPDLPAPNDVAWPGHSIKVLVCSGMILEADPTDQDHHPKCNRNMCGVTTLESELEVAIFNENAAWMRAGINVSAHVPFDAFKADQILQTVIDVLYEAGLITKEDFVARMQQRILNELKEKRAVLEPEMRKARARAGIALPGSPSLFGPNGEVLQ